MHGHEQSRFPLQELAAPLLLLCRLPALPTKRTTLTKYISLPLHGYWRHRRCGQVGDPAAFHVIQELRNVANTDATSIKVYL